MPVNLFIEQGQIIVMNLVKKKSCPMFQQKITSYIKELQHLLIQCFMVEFQMELAWNS